MRQIAEHLVRSGHQVTVATTRLPARDFRSYNGVAIEEFSVSGNIASGMTGEVARFQAFVKSFPADAILIKAAQQWTFDAVWPVLDSIRARKVFIPCGFSGLYLDEYRTYFRDLPDILRKFDHLIFYAGNYRDINFAREHRIEHFSIVPNGASETEFAVARDPRFRQSLGIPEKDFLILTVGSPIVSKGHTELAAAFTRIRTRRGCRDFLRRRPVSLILNGDWPAADLSQPEPLPYPPPVELCSSALGEPVAPAIPRRTMHRVLNLWKLRGALFIVGHTGRFFLRYFNRRIAQPWRRIMGNIKARTEQLLDAVDIRRPPMPPPQTIEDWIAAARAQRGKRVFTTRLSRPDTIQAFLAADLFVFASNIEYSPLVLFEAAAAGVPFLTVPVGNSPEIVQWTGGGVLCPAPIDKRGFTRAEPEVLARSIEAMIEDHELCARLGQAGREAWRQKFNWATIAKSYEAILMGQAAAQAQEDHCRNA